MRRIVGGWTPAMHRLTSTVAMPRLAAFIRENTRQILEEWEAFARTLSLGTPMSVQALRDHAQGMLEVIASDLEMPQEAREQSEKSKGLLDVEHRAPTAAADHGSGRASSGYTVVQMVAEFRALRASVIRLWTARQQHFGPVETEDLIRFNEAIDQAVAQSLAQYTRRIDETRDRFLAVLGHDLRSPLGAVITSTKFLAETDGLTAEQSSLVRAIESAGTRMTGLVTDLLDLALSRLGDGIPITRSETDLRQLLQEVAVEVSASYPQARIETHFSGELTGEWDGPRLAQAVTNLVANAVQHSGADGPIVIEARADGDDVTIAVHDQGRAIPQETVRGLFRGMRGRLTGDRDRRHLGLGLYIVEKIVVAHGGTVDVQSTNEHGTTFTIRLPKSASAGRGLSADASRAI